MGLPFDSSDTFASVVEGTGRSVVRVEGGRSRPVSGLAISPTQIVTVSHGLERDEIVVGLEGVALKAHLRGRDDSTDLALLELEGGELPPARLDDGGQLKVGHSVLRLARPGETVRATTGIVSALGKKSYRASRGGEIDRYLETDAAHLPGFSGGPVVTSSGAVVGITSSALLRHVSLAIPTITIRRVVAELEQHGRVRRSHLGLKLQPVQLPEPVHALTQEEIGLLVIEVEKGGPAEAAGVVYGDTLLHLGDESVRTLHDLYGYLRQDHGGRTVPMKVFRHQEVVTLQVTLGAK